jgi:hypothetical protein
MLKSTFFWRELYRISPVAVERSACVWMLNGARNQIQLELKAKIEAAIADAANGDASQVLEAEIIPVNVEEIMAHLDATHQHERRIVLSVLLISGLVLTIQPWLALNFFSLPLMLAGGMLLGLEFSPRTGLGIIGMVKRFKANSDIRKL